MTSKLSFRARALDATKFLPIYCEHEIPDNADCSFINRAVPQMPTGMEKEEESEHHLQRAICAGTVIPTPEVLDIEDVSYYDRLYPQDYKMPRQLIYMQPFSMEADIPDYDMDSEDEHWVNSQSVKLELTSDKFEEMMDRLEKGSGQTVVTLQEAKALIKEDDDLIIAVYDYWLNKRLKTQHPLISQVRTEARFGVSNHNPYIAFRRRTEKMQTRKNRKNDESSYEKMLKLKRDLTRAVTLLEMVKRREKSKRELLHLSIEVFEKRYQIGDFAGQLVAEALSQRPTRPVFSPLLQSNHLSWLKGDPAFGSINRKEKRHYKKRRHKSSSKMQNAASTSFANSGLYFHDQNHIFSRDPGSLTSEEEPAVEQPPSDGEEEDEDGEYAFRRKMNCNYHPIRDTGSSYPFPDDDKRFRFCPTSITNDKGRSGFRYVGYCRRRVGRGGRVILDRMSYRNQDDFWRSMGYNVMESSDLAVPEGSNSSQQSTRNLSQEKADSNPSKCSHFRPKTPPENVEPVSPNETHELEDTGQNEVIFNTSGRSAASVTLCNYISAVMTAGENPMVFDVNTLLNDPQPHAICRPAYLTSAVEQDIYESDLFNNDLNVDFSSFEGESDVDFMTPWYPSVDTGTADFLTSNSVHESFPEDEPVLPDTGKYTDSSGFGQPDTAVLEVAKDDTVSCDQDTLVDEDDSEIVENSASNTSESDRRHLCKDDKENDRIVLSAHTRDNVRDRAVVTEEESVERVVVNGGPTVDSSEECTGVEEQKPNFVLPSKQWMCNCIT